MRITSPDFGHQQKIPGLFTCKGKDINPALRISDVPPEAKTLALIVDDPDAPGKTWVHWVVYNIPPGTREIAQASIPGEQAGNDFGQTDYGGPCPPSGTHRYFFKLYALDTQITAKPRNKADLEKAMKGHILAQAELIGLFSKT